MKNYAYPKSYDMLNDEQKQAFDMLVYGLDNNINFLLTGNAGTGKSFLANAYYEFCVLNKITMLKGAPTGAAAVRISGVTLHKLFKFNFGVASTTLTNKQIMNAKNILMMASVIFIDEISMVRCDFVENIWAQISMVNKWRKDRKKPPIQIIVCGDFGQLKPIVTQADAQTYAEVYNKPIDGGEAYTAAAWNNFDFKTIMLTTQVRQSDAKFYHALESIKIGTPGGLQFVNDNTSKTVIPNAIWVCGRKNTVDALNEMCLARIPEKEYVNNAVETGFAKVSQTNFADILKYKIGARVVMVMNDANHQYVNGTMGTITDVFEGIDCNTVEIQFDDGGTGKITPVYADVFEYRVNNGIVEQYSIGRVIQYPFKLGYAVTVHKAQGATYAKMNFNPEIFAEGQLYTALSRAQSIDKIYIKGGLTPKHVIPSQATMNYLINLMAKADAWKKEYASLTGTSANANA